MRCFDPLSRRAQAASKLVLLLLLMVALSAAEKLRLLCNVSALPEGRFRYQVWTKPGLEPAPFTLGCRQRGWQDRNNTVLTLGMKRDEVRVYNHSDWDLEPYQCLDYAHFTADCSVFVEAICETNCSSLTQPPSVDSPSSSPQIMDQSMILAVCLPVSLGLVVAGIICFWKVLLPLYKRWRESYHQARSREPDPEQPDDQENGF